MQRSILFLSAFTIAYALKLDVYHALTPLTSTISFEKRGTLEPSSKTLVESAGSLDKLVQRVSSASKDVYYVVEVRSETETWRSSLPSCMLTNKDTTMVFQVHYDVDNTLYHVDMGVSVPDGASTCLEGLKLVAPKRTNVTRVSMSEGPRPKLELRRSEGSDALGQQEDERTFFQKYWLYILIGSLVLLIR